MAMQSRRVASNSGSRYAAIEMKILDVDFTDFTVPVMGDTG
jgi:hypothetical protein